MCCAGNGPVEAGTLGQFSRPKVSTKDTDVSLPRIFFQVIALLAAESKNIKIHLPSAPPGGFILCGRTPCLNPPSCHLAGRTLEGEEGASPWGLGPPHLFIILGLALGLGKLWENRQRPWKKALS